jgi:hypothetical protein
MVLNKQWFGGGGLRGVKVALTTRDAPDGTVYESLTIGRVYDVLGIEGDWLRLFSDRGEPVLFDPACFEVIEASEPANWVSVVDDGCRYAYPAEWGQPGFFEDWHDGVSAVRAAFSAQLRKWHPSVAPDAEPGAEADRGGM